MGCFCIRQAGCFLCFSLQDLDCYVIDNHGFVLVSKQQNDVSALAHRQICLPQFVAASAKLMLYLSLVLFPDRREDSWVRLTAQS